MALVDMGALKGLGERKVAAAVHLVVLVVKVGVVVSAEGAVLDRRIGMSTGRTPFSYPESYIRHWPSTNGTCGRQMSRQSTFPAPCTGQGMHRQNIRSRACALA